MRVLSLAVVLSIFVGVFGFGNCFAVESCGARGCSTSGADAKEAAVGGDVKAEVKAEVKTAVKEAPKKAVEDKLIVTVDGEKVMQSDIDKETDKRLEVELSRYQSRGQQVPENIKSQIRAEISNGVLDMIIDRKVMENKIELLKIKVTDKDIDAKIEEITKANNIKTEDIESELAKGGVTLAEFRGQLKSGIGVEFLIKQEVGEFKSDEKEAKEYFDGNAEQFVKNPEQVRASHILIKTSRGGENGSKSEPFNEEEKKQAKAKLEDILKQAKGGADFAELAKKYTEDPGSKANGGEYTFGRGKMVAEFDKTAFELEVDQISDVFETSFGYHIVKLSEKIPAANFEFEEVKDKLVSWLKEKKEREARDVYRKGLRKEAKIEWADVDKAAKEAKIAEAALMKAAAEKAAKDKETDAEKK